MESRRPTGKRGVWRRRRGPADPSCGASALFVAGVIALGCAGEPPPQPSLPGTTAPSASAATAPPAEDPAPEYVLSDPEGRPRETRVLLETDKWGVIIDGARIVASPDSAIVAPTMVEPPLRNVLAWPARWGGGFLFWNSAALYTAAQFDGDLKPLAAVPAAIDAISFGPDFLLVRASNGERWTFDPITGARKRSSLPGLVDVAAAPDGRAFAITEAGGLHASSDSGKTWSDVRPMLLGWPGAVVEQGGLVFAEDTQGATSRALRLDASGPVVIDRIPPRPGPVGRDPRTDRAAIVRAALHHGARTGPWSAAVAVLGDIVRVDLTTGAIVSRAAGVLPVDLPCEAVEVPDDVVFVCAASNRASVVVSGVLREGGPRVERSFPTEGPFFASDDGAIAFAGPCGKKEKDDDPEKPAEKGIETHTRHACVRNAAGQWEPFAIRFQVEDVPTLAAATATTAPRAPTFAVPPDPRNIRWIPRLDRPPVAAFVETGTLYMFDAAWGEPRAWITPDEKPEVVARLLRAASPQRGGGAVDRTWQATPAGAIRSMLDDGSGFEVSPDGALTRWPFAFDRVAMAASRAIASSRDRRLFQTTDRGRSWSEIAPVPWIKTSPYSFGGCSTLGCDLGIWLRFGWESRRAAAPRVAPSVVAAPPLAAPPPLAELTCLVTGTTETKRTPVLDAFSFTDARGLGASPLPDPTMDSGGTQQRSTLLRTIVRPVTASDQLGIEPSPRLAISGHISEVVTPDTPTPGPPAVFMIGPGERRTRGYKREIAFVEPLSPDAAIRKTTFDGGPIERALQMPFGVYIEQAPLEPMTQAPVAGLARGAADLVVGFDAHVDRPLFAIVRGGASPRVDFFPGIGEDAPVSGAFISATDAAVLFVSLQGAGQLVRTGNGVVTKLASIPPPPWESAYPANPDVVAVGPQDEVALIRTPSGAEPPSAEDPAWLIRKGGRLTPLAPWSSLRMASDPACVADTSGYRAVIQVAGAWLRVSGHVVPKGATSGMLAAVRWSATQVCLDGIELVESLGTDTNPTERIVTARFGAKPGGEGVVSEISLGSEARTRVSCALGSP